MIKPKKQTEDIFNAEEIMHEQEEILSAYRKCKDKPLRILFSFFKLHYKKLLASSFFYVLKTMPTWLVPLIFAYIVDVAIQKPDDAWVKILICAIIGAIAIFQNIPTHMLYVKFFSKAKRDVEAGLRGAMVRKLQHLSISFHKDMAAGRIQSKVMRDVEAVEGMAGQLFSVILDVTFNLLITLSIVLFTNIYVFIMFLFCVPLAVFLRQLFSKKMRERSREFRKSVESTSASVMDMIELVPVSRAHALEEYEIKKMTDNVTEVARAGYKFDYIQNFFGAANWAFLMFFQLFCLIVTGFMAFKGIITVGSVTMFQTYFANIIGKVSSVIGLLPVFAKGTEALISIGEILNDENVEDNNGKYKLESLNGEYSFKNVKFKYDDDTPVLKGLNLEVKAGETVAFVGESGAGKSTILNLIIGFHTPDSGSLLIDGRDIKEINLHEYRKFISVVPQETILFSGSIRDNITYGSPNISEEKLGEIIRAAKLESVIDNLPNGLDTSIGEHGSKLSGGQRQRISIARAIIRNPRVIIFDEATSALDSETEREIQSAIDSLSEGRTTFIVAHRLSTVRNADKIAVMKNGVCVEFGSYDELMAKKGAFYALKTLQS